MSRTALTDSMKRAPPETRVLYRIGPTMRAALRLLAGWGVPGTGRPWRRRSQRKPGSGCGAPLLGRVPGGDGPCARQSGAPVGHGPAVCVEAYPIAPK